MTRAFADRRFLYRCLDADDRLLYVGITSNIDHRVATHRRSWWGYHIARVAVTEYRDGLAARAVERVAIVAEAPRFNLQGRWANRSSWTADQYRDYFVTVQNSPFSGHQAGRLAKTRSECLDRYGVDVALEAKEALA